MEESGSHLAPSGKSLSLFSLSFVSERLILEMMILCRKKKTKRRLILIGKSAFFLCVLSSYLVVPTLKSVGGVSYSDEHPNFFSFFPTL